MVFCFYGLDRLSDDIHFLTGKRPLKYLTVIWRLLPFTTIVRFPLNILRQIYRHENFFLILGHICCSFDQIQNRWFRKSGVYSCARSILCHNGNCADKHNFVCNIPERSRKSMSSNTFLTFIPS